MVSERVLSLHGIHNFRDYGGYAARDGRALRSGLLWRSGQHCDATGADLERVAQLGLATVIDLRGNSERANFPCLRHTGFAAEVLFADGETAGAAHAPHVEAAREVRTAAEAHAAMVRLYTTMAFRPNLVAVLRLYFAALAEREGPSLLHCLAGKDRTGLAAGLLHHLLGVHHDDLMADYMLTNIAGNVERRIAAGAIVVRGSFGKSMEEDAVRTLMSVHSEYLDTAFASIRAEHQTIEAYARPVLGMTPERLVALEARLLV